MNQEFLPYIAGALQWARARKKFAEVWFLLIVAAASFVFYLMAHPTDAFSVPWNMIVLGWWEQAKTILATVQVISSTSNVVVAVRGDNPVPGMVPVTDSQP